MNIKLTRNPIDVARGYDNLYYTEFIDNGEYIIVETRSNDVLDSSITELWLLENIETGERILLGSNRNMGHWIGLKRNTMPKTQNWDDINMLFFA